jgi:hypothetical protein
MNVHESYFLFVVIYIRNNVDVKDHKSDDISIMIYILESADDCQPMIAMIATRNELSQLLKGHAVLVMIGYIAHTLW